MADPQLTITVEFTVSRMYRAEIDRKLFPNLPSVRDPEDLDATAEEIQRWLGRRWTDQQQLADIYGNDDNWDGDEPDVEVEDVEVTR